ncbi:MAG: NUDIX hydrolase [Bacillota bacterium]
MKDIFKRLAGRKPAFANNSSQLVSAVLLPLIKKDEKYHILFEVRSQDLKRQPGEICFPGGKVERLDQCDPKAAAVRETAEELGIRESDIRVAGPLDVMVTPFGAMIYPFAGEITTRDIRPNPKEVEETFLVPVDFFLNEPPYVTYVDVGTKYNNDFPLEMVPPVYGGGWQIRMSYPMYYYHYNKYFIWGMTGIILFNFLSICWPESPVFKKPHKTWK